MDENLRHAVERSLRTMKDNLGEPLTIEDMARSAMFSKFHFARMFARATGTTPGRFLAAMRLAEAKRLLLRTDDLVADIGHQVGYQSVGTFSARFSGSVGISPRTYRRLGGRTGRIPESGAQGTGAAFALRGHVTAAQGVEFGPVFVGLFPGPIMEGVPARYTFLDRPGAYTLHDVPTGGSWHLFAHAFGYAPDGEPAPRPFLCHDGPVATRDDLTGRIAEVHLRPWRPFDPPVLLALPDMQPALGLPCSAAG